MRANKKKTAMIMMVLFSLILCSLMAYAEYQLKSSKSYPTITVYFSDPVQSQSVNPNIYHDENGMPEPTPILTANNQNLSFQFRPSSQALLPGDYRFAINATDISNNAGITKEKFFTIDYTNMGLIVLSPPTNASLTTSFSNIQMQTERQAECRWGRDTVTFNDFTSTNQAYPFVHTIASYQIQNGQQQETMYVQCYDTTPGTPITEPFIYAINFKVDTLAPHITNAYINSPGNNATASDPFLLIAETNELTRCKYDLFSSADPINSASGVYFDTDTMNLPSNYRTTHYAEVPTPGAEGIYTLTIKCYDGVGLYSNTTTFSYMYNSSLPLTITNITPTFSTETYIDLRVRTNKDATCGYTTVIGSNILEPMEKIMGGVHTALVTGLSEGAKTYYVKCTDFGGTSKTIPVTFRVDLTDPTVAIALNPSNATSNPDQTYYDSQLNATITVADSVSGEKKFVYQVINVTDGAHDITYSGEINYAYLIGPGSNTYTGFVPTNLMQHGESYLLSGYAIDNAGRQSSTVESNALTVNLTAKLIMTLIKPNAWGVSPNITFDIMVNTARLSNCSWNTFSNSVSWWNQFNNTEPARNHSIFSKTLLNGQTMDLYVKCNDPTLNQTYYGQFKLSVDISPPVITNAYTNYLDNGQNIMTEPLPLKIYATTDKLSQCKYSLVPDFDYNTETDAVLFDDSYGGFNTNMATTVTQSRFIPTVAAPPLMIFIKCLNQAGKVSPQYPLAVSYDPTVPLSIISVNTPSAVSINSFYLNVTLNKYLADCMYYNDSNYAPPIYGYFANTPETRDYTLMVAVAKEGTYTYYVKCIDPMQTSATAAITVSYDTTPPVMMSVVLIPPNSSYPTKTYFTDRLSARIIAKEDVSSIDSFQYYVLKMPGKAVVDSGTITDVSRDENNASLFVFEGAVTGLDLNDTSTYTMTAIAHNTAGKNSTNATSNNSMTVDRSLTPVTCSNGIKDGGETGIDCGQVCPTQCQTGVNCTTGADCISDVCNSSNRCALPTCNDGVQNGDETDIDCGGSCTANCGTGDDCDRNSDCQSNICEDGKCISTTDLCINGRLDDGETGVDCGGVCPDKCGTSEPCTKPSDCISNVCLSGLCQVATCSDHVLNQGESYIDCGGPCQKCADGTPCNYPSDCTSTNCVNRICQPAGGGGTEVEGGDTDGDGMPDDWETKYGLDPNDPSDGSADSDNDGLTNFEEYRYHTNPTAIDTDGDGYNDKEEIDAGTNPNDASSHPGGLGWLLILIIIVVLLILGALGYLGYQYYQKNQKPPKGLGGMGRPMPPQRPMQRPMMQRPMQRPMQQPIRREENKVTQIFKSQAGGAAVKTTETEEYAELSSLGKGKKTGGRDDTSSVFDRLSNLKTMTAKDRKGVFDRLHNMSGDEVKTSDIKKVSEAKNTDVKDLVKSLNIIAEKNLNNNVSNELMKSLDNLADSHKQLKTEIHKVANKLESKSGVMIASRDGGKFHKPTCIAAKNISKGRQVAFKDRKEAMSKGYKPCSVCNS